MSFDVKMGLENPKAIPTWVGISKAFEQPDVVKAMGRAVFTLLREHFTALDGSRANQLGGNRTHFYGKARRAVQQPQLIGGDAVKVSIAHKGIAQRYYGGDIVPTKRKALTIPVHPSAYGHRAREFNDLEYIPTKGRALAILARPHNQGNIGEVMYVLVKKVHQKPDRTVIPDEQTRSAAAYDAAKAYLTHKMRMNN